MIRNEKGAFNALVAGLILMSTLFVFTLGFAAWSFLSRQDYKNNTDEKIDAAVKVAEKKVATEKDNEYLEKEKFPLKSYKAPEDLGALTLSYPKTWSGYISSSSENFFIFNPDVVTERDDSLYALKVSVEDQEYSDYITQYESNVEQGTLSAKAYSLPRVSSVVGVKFTGEFESDKNGSVVVLPLRDKTIIIECAIPDRVDDFNKIILPNIKFNP